MCEKCSILKRTSFDSYQAFQNFEGVLDEKVNKKLLTVHENPSESNFFNTAYRCVNCSEIWWLSVPNNSWHGYFVSVHEAKDYLKKIKNRDRRKALGCVILVALMVALSLYLIF